MAAGWVAHNKVLLVGGRDLGQNGCSLSNITTALHVTHTCPCQMLLTAAQKAHLGTEGPNNNPNVIASCHIWRLLLHTSWSVHLIPQVALIVKWGYLRACILEVMTINTRYTTQIFGHKDCTFPFCCFIFTKNKKSNSDMTCV